MSRQNYDEHKSQWKAKMNTQYVPLRQTTEEKTQGKELKEVWDDSNGWNETEVQMTEMKGREELKST